MNISEFSTIVLTLLVASGLVFGCSSNQSNTPSDNTELPPGFENVTDRVWVLRQFTNASGSVESVPVETPFRIFLSSEDYDFTAYFVCATFSDGHYSASDGYFSLSYGTTEGVVCVSEEDPNYEQGIRIRELLMQSSDFHHIYDVEGNQLTLTAASGRYMVFEEVESLRLSSNPKQNHGYVVTDDDRFVWLSR